MHDPQEYNRDNGNWGCGPVTFDQCVANARSQTSALSREFEIERQAEEIAKTMKRGDPRPENCDAVTFRAWFLAQRHGQ